MPRLTGTRSRLKYEMGCTTPSWYTTKSSCVRFGTKRPYASVTVADTFTSSTPVLNRNLGSCCPPTGRREHDRDGGQDRRRRDAAETG